MRCMAASSNWQTTRTPHALETPVRLCKSGSAAAECPKRLGVSNREVSDHLCANPVAYLHAVKAICEVIQQKCVTRD